LEVKVKKAHLSPVTSLLVSFSLAFGILVSIEVEVRALTLILAGVTVILVFNRLATAASQMFEMLVEKLRSFTINIDLRTKEDLALKEQVPSSAVILPRSDSHREEESHKNRS
jgi:hypothetical protein